MRCHHTVLGLLVMVVLACKPDASSGGSLGSPNASIAGREATSPSALGGTSTAGSTGGLARSLVAVAATSSGEAQPCERTCGRVGDCLLETQDTDDSRYRAEFESGRLELECLDLCVHAAESDAPRSTFLDCEKQSGCGELLGCARSNWDALAASRAAAGVQGVGIIRRGDSCGEGCRWMYSCIWTGAPPGQAYLDPMYEEQIRACETQCEYLSPADREVYAHYAECLPSNCSPDRYEVCFGYAY